MQVMVKLEERFLKKEQSKQLKNNKLKR